MRRAWKVRAAGCAENAFFFVMRPGPSFLAALTAEASSKVVLGVFPLAERAANAAAMAWASGSSPNSESAREISSLLARASHSAPPPRGEPLGRGPPARAVHAHVERAVGLKGHTALGPVELHGGDSQVG